MPLKDAGETPSLWSHLKHVSVCRFVSTVFAPLRKVCTCSVLCISVQQAAKVHPSNRAVYSGRRADTLQQASRLLCVFMCVCACVCAFDIVYLLCVSLCLTVHLPMPGDV